VAVYNEQLHLIWKNGDCMYYAYAYTVKGMPQDLQWEGGWMINPPGGSKHTTDRSPALAVFNGRLYAAWKAVDSSTTWFAWMEDDGLTWTDRFVVPDGHTRRSPALATYNGRLYNLRTGVDEKTIFYSYMSDDGVAEVSSQTAQARAGGA
jgi:hypothetical protein